MPPDLPPPNRRGLSILIVKGRMCQAPGVLCSFPLAASVEELGPTNRSVWGSRSASSVLLIALIGGVLLDVTVAALRVEVFATGDFVLQDHLRIRSWSFIAPLLGRYRRHL